MTDASIETLQAEIDRLKKQLATKTKVEPVEYLGETIPGVVLSELGANRNLSAAGVRAAGVGMHGDGGNLWLQVTKGGRSWLFRYRWGDKQREMGLGSHSEVTLSEARGRALICRRLVRSGVDPIERRRQIATAEDVLIAKQVTFKDAAERYIKAHEGSWRNPKHAAQWPSTMKTYIYPVIGELPVQTVDTGLVLKILEPIWSSKPETASRIRGRIESVLDWATARGYRRGDNPARWRGHVDKLLPARSKVRTVKHHAAVAWTDINAFWRELACHEGMSAEALRFTILTGARTSEVTGATWAEVDLDAKTWTVPKERMKAGKEHRVPLSDAAIDVLERMKPLASAKQPFLFPGAKAGRPLSNMAMLMLVKDMDRPGLTVHGFRSAFRDWAAESTAYAGDLVEMALAHAIGNKVEASYRRGDMFDRRRRLMDDWAKHCTAGPAEAGSLHHIGEAR